MTDNERKQTGDRPTPPDALALPHVVEAIAMCLSDQDDFSSHLHAVPRSLWTPALSAFLDCNSTTPHSVRANWPHIKLRDMDLQPSVLALLAATLPLRPRIQLHCFILDATQLASLVAVLGPALSSVRLHFLGHHVVDRQVHAISSLLLQRCPRLWQVSIRVGINWATDIVELNGLLDVVAHPHVHDFPRPPYHDSAISWILGS
ncbi:hypothetical protein SPRG_00087 [Saprolegnia parasitica CBS 223.65]|uniref:Uncharacterized protein n=1 Tax=Saprolegnia parasitica (strain CBS 223.65) TaxID=695850 RepID=A0A067D8C0_SAPPC|nr:hypothetical protein SPRG_00087 [Saprolegnia parasitica CBS 223.65]KDO35242.1 hypothetical protein SPRG_00087 [Saprolegnia parasitica CBS 223.65]|eukprot:XP_012193593.1 hypothetical protein SPRG_00087 [Saprolegnia parasitica CBS 223.65]